MIGKIIRSMTQGSTKTKLFLWAMILLGIASVVLFVAAWIMQIPVFVLAALVLLAVAFGAVNSVTINTQKAQKSNKDAYDAREEDARSPQERQREKARYLASLKQKDVKKILKQHKVSQSHQKIMIDSYQERKLEQVPAFAWRTEKTLHFLVLEGHANEFEIPMDQIRGIYYEKNVTADIEKDYVPFQYSSYIAKMFQDYLPEYAERNVDGELVYQKNLFYLSNGLYITNTSMANLMKLLPKVPFLLDDNVCRSNRLDAYFKEIYKNRVLCETHAITMDQYRQTIEDTLETLIQAPISGQEFVKSLRDMSKYHLIDQQQVSRCSQKYRQVKKI